MAHSLLKLGAPLAGALFLAFTGASLTTGCGGDDEGDNGGDGGSTSDAGSGGSSATGGGAATGGGSATGGAAATGGATGDAGDPYTCEARVAMNMPNPSGSAAAGAECCSGLGNCKTAAELADDPTGYAYGHDDCSEELQCAPKAVSDILDSGVLPSCTTTIGKLELEGRCLPKCFVLGDPAAPNLNAGDCPTEFGGEEVLCTPCYNPIDGELTGACAREGDPGPVEPAPTPFKPCGVVGSGEPGGVCVPTTLIEASGAPVDAIPQDICEADELCAPTNKVRDINTCFTKCEFSAAGAFTGPGACVAPYLVENTMEGGSDLLDPSPACAADEECAPCVNPLDNAVTGACDN